MTKLHELAAAGQAAWFDFIKRSFIISGELQELVDNGIRGVTSNPAIFEQAIAGSSDYDEAMKILIKEGKSDDEIYEHLALDDIARAADILHRVYKETHGTDGYVSIEVNPNLANNTEDSIAEARHLFKSLARPNVMIKIPATEAGIPVITTLISENINVNVTLIFSLSHYEKVAWAYIEGLEKLHAAGGDLGKVASVASFFVSRVDTSVDAILAEMGRPELQGKIAVDNARMAYARYTEIFSGKRWQALAKAGASVQRPLWASTGTKNPDYPATLYVDTLIGPDTVNTIPPATLKAFLASGTVSRTVDTDLEGARTRLADIAALGIDLEAVTRKLQDDGVVAFTKPFANLMDSIAKKRNQLLNSA